MNIENEERVQLKCLGEDIQKVLMSHNCIYSIQFLDQLMSMLCITIVFFDSHAACIFGGQITVFDQFMDEQRSI